MEKKKLLYRYNKECNKQADVAQLVEQLICNQPVVGSSPTVGSIDRVNKLTKHLQLKSPLTTAEYIRYL